MIGYKISLKTRHKNEVADVVIAIANHIKATNNKMVEIELEVEFE